MNGDEERWSFLLGWGADFTFAFALGSARGSALGSTERLGLLLRGCGRACQPLALFAATLWSAEQRTAALWTAATQYRHMDSRPLWAL